MHILLISPTWDKYRAWPYHMSLLGALTVAGLTPEGHEVEYIDCSCEEVDYSRPVDLVAISSMTVQANRAYDIADKFRAKGKPVVLGGLHPTLLPDEALGHADAVVIGEAESCWEALLEDFQNDNLKKIYDEAEKPGAHELYKKPPRRDLLKDSGYTKTLEGRRAIDTLQISRGCFNNCKYCSVPSAFGIKVRTRSIESIERELQTIDAKYIFFVDDTIPLDKNYFLKVLNLLVKYKKRWFSVGSLSMAKDPSFLKMCADSGCLFFYLGFDRLHEGWKIQTQKQQMLGQYRLDIKKYDAVGFAPKYLSDPDHLDAIRTIQDAGIGIFGTFIFGFDTDTEDVFEQTIQFCKSAKIDLADFAILTPYPRSPLALELEKQDRIKTRDWNKYTGEHVVFEPKNLTAEQLKEGSDWAWEEFYKEKSKFHRMATLFRR